MRTILLLLFTVVSFQLSAQLLTTSPEFPTDNSSISIIVDCSKGNQGLMNYGNTNDVYVHIGLITNLSTNTSDWRYSKFAWGSTVTEAKANYIGNNKFQYTISNIRTFFGVPAGETIRKIAILFRNGSGSVVQRTSDPALDMGNMYIQVYDNTPAAKFILPPYESFFVPKPEPINKSVGSSIDLRYKSNQTGSLQLFFNGVSIASTVATDTVQGSPTITSSGNQQIVGRFTNGTVTLSDTINFVAAQPVNIAPLPSGVKDGINYLPNETSVILVLFAPNKNLVNVIGEFNNWTPGGSYQMNKTPDGNYFWLRIDNLVAGQEYAYQYLIDGNLRVADYYTEKVLDPTHDPFIPAATYPGLKPYPAGATGLVSVLQTRAPAYNWRNTNFQKPEKKNLIIYEMLVRDFVAAHDYKTLIDTLSYLKRLGVNAIELMPVNEFEGNSSWGYNTSFFFAPDKYYGPKNKLKEFIDSCHSNGIAVIFDLVLNHTYQQSPMVKMYSNPSTGKPTPDNPWYNVVAPHAFGFGEDLNHESAATKYFASRVLRHWLEEYKFDGYRLDFTKGLTQKPSSNDGEFSAYDASRVAIIKRMYDTVQAVSPGAYVILEHLCDNSEEKDLSAMGMLLWGNTNFNFMEAAMGYHDQGKSNFDWGIHTKRGWAEPHLMAYMESHDEERLMYKSVKYGNSSGSYNIRDTGIALRRSEMAAAFYLAIPGPKMIWQFGELGYDVSRCYLSSNNDESGNCDKKLDPKPIRWNYQTDPSRKRHFEIYAALIKLRKNYPNPFIAGNISYNLANSVKTMQVVHNDLSIVVLGNFDVTSQNLSYTFPGAGTWYNYLTGEPFTATGANQTFTLAAGEYRFLVNKNVVNAVVTSIPDIIGNSSGLMALVYPNPVNQQSRIVYTLPEAAIVEIELIDLMGRRLSEFKTGRQLKGDHQLEIRKLHPNVEGLPSSIYYISIRAGNQKLVKKIML